MHVSIRTGGAGGSLVTVGSLAAGLELVVLLPLPGRLLAMGTYGLGFTTVSMSTFSTGMGDPTIWPYLVDLVGWNTSCPPSCRLAPSTEPFPAGVGVGGFGA